MPRNTFDREIKHLKDELLILGSMAEQAIQRAVDTLRARDVKAARQILRDDAAINEKRFAIENATLILLATQQPMARDLRFMAALLELSTELERIGDYAKGIAKITIRLRTADVEIPINDLLKMSALGTDMLHRALGAFVSEDVKTASRIPAEDDEVDALYNIVYTKLVKAMIAHPERIDYTNLVLWVAHNLERTADRVTNICERTIFIATGELMEIDSSDDEDGEG